MSRDQEKKNEFEEEMLRKCGEKRNLCWCGLHFSKQLFLRAHWKANGGLAKHLCEWAYEDKRLERPEWEDIVGSVVSQYVNNEEATIITNRKMLDMLKAKGKITINPIATEWKVRYR